VRRMDPILIQNLQRAGVTVHTPTPAERQSFAAVGRPVGERTAREIGAAARTLLKALRP